MEGRSRRLDRQAKCIEVHPKFVPPKVENIAKTQPILIIYRIRKNEK